MQYWCQQCDAAVWLGAIVINKRLANAKAAGRRCWLLLALAGLTTVWADPAPDLCQMSEQGSQRWTTVLLPVAGDDLGK